LYLFKQCRPPTNLSLTHVLSESNTTGVSADGVHASVWLAQSTLIGNAQSFFVSNGGSTIFTYLDNYIAAANGPPFGSLATFGKQ
jgi:phosphatidate phosphatase APP1